MSIAFWDFKRGELGSWFSEFYITLLLFNWLGDQLFEGGILNDFGIFF